MLHSEQFADQAHSRPHTSNDNPFSEAQFKTLKYRPDFPDRFGSLEDARGFCQDFFPWYNTQHRHSGIGLLTPEDLHFGRGEKVRQVRQAALMVACEKRPERFVRKPPEPPALPTAVWINPPAGAPRVDDLLQAGDWLTPARLPPQCSCLSRRPGDSQPGWEPRALCASGCHSRGGEPGPVPAMDGRTDTRYLSYLTCIGAF